MPCWEGCRGTRAQRFRSQTQPTPHAQPNRHAKNLNSDPWRKLQLWKATANPKHPFRWVGGWVECVGGWVREWGWV